MKEEQIMLPLGYDRDDYLRKGTIWRIEIPSIEVSDFAMIILSLTNMRSSGSLGIVDVRTFVDCNTIRVIFEGVRKDIPYSYLSDLMRGAAGFRAPEIEHSILFDGPIEIVEIEAICFDETDIVDDDLNVFVKYKW